MAKVQVLNKSGQKISEINAPLEVFSYPAKEHLVYEAVVNYLSNQRRGTASTKTRNEVKGGGRKPWRQKGTGRARAGSIRSPLWRKGGTTFGPKPRDYYYSIPKKAKKNALRSVLSAKLEEKLILVVDSLEFDSPKTKNGVELLNKLNIDSALIIDNKENKNMFLALRNIPRVKPLDQSNLGVIDVLKYKWLVFSQRAFDSLMERLK